MKRLKKIMVFSCLVLLTAGALQAKKQELTVCLRGVSDSKITLKPFNGITFGQPLRVRNDIKSGEKVIFEIPGEMLPGEFMLRFDYRKDQDSNPYPGELQLYLNKESITVHANPGTCMAIVCNWKTIGRIRLGSAFRKRVPGKNK